jgi:hypothetical protein
MGRLKRGAKFQVIKDPNGRKQIGYCNIHSVYSAIYCIHNQELLLPCFSSESVASGSEILSSGSNRVARLIARETANSCRPFVTRHTKPVRRMASVQIA